MTPKAVIYCRVSTAKQAEEGVSLDTQEAACRRLAESWGFPVAGVHVEDGLTGSTPLAERPALLKALAELEEGDLLMVLRRERIFRADDHGRGEILAAIEDRGAVLISTQNEGTWGNSSSDYVFRGIVDVMSYGEKLRIGERTREALQRKRDQGERIGSIPYGSKLADDGIHLEPDPADVGLVDLARKLHADGLSYARIAEWLWDVGYRPKQGGARWPLTSIRRLVGKVKPWRKTRSSTSFAPPSPPPRKASTSSPNAPRSPDNPSPDSSGANAA